MSLMTEGKTPGPVRYYLACDRGGCGARIMFDLVISDPGPPREEDFFGYLLHPAEEAAPHISGLGWTFLQGDGYWCPGCSG
ncbi:hypothetical protein [Streptomyces aidingensis]|nr:hypothetical protein [Streptomyces aidingensis]